MVNCISVITCLFMIMLTSCSVATDHTVGDLAGWTLGLNYTSWSAGKNFTVGDNLVFKYSREHTVGEVNSEEYGSCALEDSITILAKKRSKRMHKSGRTHKSGRMHKSDTTIITLEDPGLHYFICAEPDHCTAGMKFAINVSAKGESATPTPLTNNSLPSAPPSKSACAGLSNAPTFVAVLLLALVLPLVCRF